MIRLFEVTTRNMYRYQYVMAIAAAAAVVCFINVTAINFTRHDFTSQHWANGTTDLLHKLETGRRVSVRYVPYVDGQPLFNLAMDKVDNAVSSSSSSSSVDTVSTPPSTTTSTTTPRPSPPSALSANVSHKVLEEDDGCRTAVIRFLHENRILQMEKESLESKLIDLTKTLTASSQDECCNKLSLQENEVVFLKLQREEQLQEIQKLKEELNTNRWDCNEVADMRARITECRKIKRIAL